MNYEYLLSRNTPAGLLNLLGVGDIAISEGILFRSLKMAVKKEEGCVSLSSVNVSDQLVMCFLSIVNNASGDNNKDNKMIEVMAIMMIAAIMIYHYMI